MIPVFRPCFYAGRARGRSIRRNELSAVIGECATPCASVWIRCPPVERACVLRRSDKRASTLIEKEEDVVISLRQQNSAVL
jgi:hypothetical protein